MCYGTCMYFDPRCSALSSIFVWVAFLFRTSFFVPVKVKLRLLALKTTRGNSTNSNVTCLPTPCPTQLFPASAVFRVLLYSIKQESHALAKRCFYSCLHVCMLSLKIKLRVINLFSSVCICKKVCWINYSRSLNYANLIVQTKLEFSVQFKSFNHQFYCNFVNYAGLEMYVHCF